MLKNMERMGLNEHVHRLNEWNRSVCSDILRSSDWFELRNSPLSDEEYSLKRIYIMQKYVYKNLDDKYKLTPVSTILEEMGDDFIIYQKRTQVQKSPEAPLATNEQIKELIDKNPSVGILIDKLGLKELRLAKNCPSNQE